VRALYDLLDSEFASAEVFRERLRTIIAPHREPFSGGYIPTLD
jgi:septum formation topological specificity factor MinE